MSPPEKRGSITCHHQPLTPPLVAMMLKQGGDNNYTSMRSLISDVTVFGRGVGPSAAEIIQRISTKPDLHKYPSGHTVIKALCARKFCFYDKCGK